MQKEEGAILALNFAAGVREDAGEFVAEEERLTEDDFLIFLHAEEVWNLQEHDVVGGDEEDALLVFDLVAFLVDFG